MKGRGLTPRTVVRLTVLVSVVAGTWTGVSMAESPRGASATGRHVDNEQRIPSDPVIFTVPEPSEAMLADMVRENDQAFAAGRPLRATRVRPQGSAVHLHEVRLSEDGQLRGRVAILVRPLGAPLAANAVTVCFVRSGAIVAQADPDREGVFHVNVPPGVYSVIAVGSGGFAASSIHVLPPGDIDDGFPKAAVTRGSQATRESTSVHAINLVAVPPDHFEALERLLEEHVRVRPRLALSTSEPPNAREQGDRSRDRTTAIYDPMSAHVVRLDQDGRLIGRMRRLHLETGRPVSVTPVSVFFIRDGVSTGEAAVDENGTFELNGLEPGAYSVVAVGPDGFAAFDILVLPPREVLSHTARDHRFRTVSNSRQSEDVPEVLNGSLVALEDVQEVLFLEDPELPPMDTPPADFCGGTGAMAGGGYSSFGHGSLFDALLGAGFGAGVGAAIGTAVAHDHIASPFSP